MVFLKKFSRRTLVTIGVIAVLLIGIRIAMPYVAKHYINRYLVNMNGYRGHVEDVGIRLYRGAYVIKGIELKKMTGKIPAPFFSASAFDFSIQWSELFHGHLVAKIEIDDPTVNFVSGPTKEQSQTGENLDWQKKIKKLSPFNINSFRINNGEIHFRNFHSDPKVDIYVQKIQALATNLTNSRKVAKTLHANIESSGIVLGNGKFKVNVNLDPYAKQPTFKLDMSVNNVDLVKLNDFLRAYGKFDVHHGTFGLYGEFAAADGKFEGYLKPLLEEVEVVRWKEDIKKPFFKLLWKAVVGAVVGVFKNQPEDRLATKIPFNGTFDDPGADIWATIGNLLKNAFIQALMPGLDNSINLKDVKK